MNSETPQILPSSITDWQEFFPFDSIRPQQEKAINFSIDQINQGKRYIILDLQTGVGKSVIAVTLANYFARKMPLREANPGAYFLTTQKILQEQYMKDFGGIKGEMASIKSASNYVCKRSKGQSCGEIRRFIQKNKSDKELMKCNMNCRYMEEKNKWMTSHLSITNYSYFLSITKYTEDISEPRQLLILDECHNVESEISGFVDIEIDATICAKIELSVPSFPSKESAIRWISDVFEPRITGRVADLETEMSYSPDASIIAEHEFMDKYMCKLHRFQEMYTDENWILNQYPQEGIKQKRLEFKPIEISQYTQDTLFQYGQIVILMSATVIDPIRFAQISGIPPDLVAFLSLESPFPPEKKPIIYAPMGKMNLDEINTTLPKIAKAIIAILKRHPNQKGIIHCFDEDQLIVMADGSMKKIKEINIGDVVMSYNENTTFFEPKSVINNFDNGIQECFELTFDDNSIVTCTPNHKFLTSNRGWIEAQYLTNEDDVISLK